MVGEISGVTRIEVLRAIRSWYKSASKKDKSRMLVLCPVGSYIYRPPPAPGFPPSRE